MTKTLRLLKKHTLLLLTIFAVQGIFAQTIRYVNASVSGGSNNGTTWANAYKDLQPALAAAQTGDQIWVAKGTYYPTINTTDRTASFVMKNNLGIYGGFAGYETALNQRNWTTNVTTLSGDIDHATDPLVVTGSGSTLNITGNAGNSYNIIFNNNNGLGSTAILDGFTVFGGGSVNNSYPDNIGNGGGMYNLSSSPSLANLIFLNNSVKFYGGGIYNGGSSPSLTNVIFLNNYASFYGGGIYYTGSPSTMNLVNCIFFGNNAGYGGGMYNSSYTSGSIFNSLFSGNYAGFYGGGMYNFGTTINVTNVVFSGNTAGLFGAGVGNNFTTSPKFVNCIVWKNGSNNVYDGIYNQNGSTPIVTYSNIQGGYTGTGNINQDPQFINAANPAGADGIFGTGDDGLALQSTSPCINKGSNAAIPTGITTDIAGLPRIIDGMVDMGAYESGYVSPTAFTGCPNLNLAIVRPGTNNYNREPVSMYYVDTAIGAATLIPGGPIKDLLTGGNIDVNGAGLNSQDGFVYAIKSVVDTAPFTATAKLYRIGSNYANTLLGTLPSPPLTGNDNGVEINPIAGAFDDKGNYYYLAATGTVITAATYADFTLNNFYIGKISGLSAVNGASPLQTSWVKVNLTNAACGPMLPGSGRLGGVQDLAYSNLYRSIYVYFDFSSGGNNYRQLLTVDPSTGIAKCYGFIAISYVSNDEISGISTTASGNLRILMTSGDVYKPVMTANGDFTSALTKIGKSGITGSSVTGSIRGDLASCNVGPTTLPTSRPSGVVISLPNAIVGYPNPAHSFVTLSANHTLSNATVRLVTLSGNVISEQTGVSGSTFKMDLSRGASGIYMVEIIEATGSSRMKIIKE